jgi:octanoyl-[GcvH]:protein N-octanoyltransferase
LAIPGYDRPGVTLALEQSLLAEFTAEALPSRTIVWESAPALVVSPSDRQLPRYANAANASAADGWPVALRSSGGSAVPVCPGILCVSMLSSFTGTPPLLARGYEAICAPIVAALAEFGVTATVGPAPGSFCDGKYNVLVNGQKIAGTAQRRTTRTGGGAILSHAVVIIDGEPKRLTSVVEKFYERAGSDRHCDPDAVTSLRRFAGPRSRASLVAEFTAALRRASTAAPIQ